MEKYAYIRGSEGVTILRCWGEPDVELPDTIDGMPVTALADHIFAPEASRRFLHAQICYAQEDGDGWRPPSSGEEAAGSRVRSVVLPPGLKEIGSYAFYGCRALRRITFPGGPLRLGSGIFTACNHLEELCFAVEAQDREAAEAEAIPCLREILGEIDYEVMVRGIAGTREWLRLLFPGYYEDSVENTPARIIEVKFEGTGYKYRQCFRGGALDLTRYDRLFYEASVQESPATAVRLALARLAVPARLTEAARAQYLAFLRDQYARCADQVFDGWERIALLQMLCRSGYFTRELLDYWEKRCVAAKDPQAAAILADYRQKRFPAKRKRYSFD